MSNGKGTGVAIVAIIIASLGTGFGVYNAFFAGEPQLTDEPVPGVYYCASGAEVQKALDTIGSGNGIITITQNIAFNDTITINGGGDYIIQGAGSVLVAIQGNKLADI